MTQANSPSTDPKAIKSLAEFIQVNAPATPIAICHANLIKEIQALLKIGADGIVGPITRQALTDFKLSNSLEGTLVIDVTTAKALLNLKGNEETASSDDSNVPEPKLNTNAGSKTGPSMTLPTGEVVYANQYIIQGIPLTWGEVTSNCTRVPTVKEYVDNALRLAKVWGGVRAKFGSPIQITSGYRPPEVNRQVGGVSNSQHLYFRAVDMKPMNGDFKTLWQVLEASEFVGLGDAVFRGRNKGFFHGDVRPGQRLVFAY
jgi:hypothetical protein